MKRHLLPRTIIVICLILFANMAEANRGIGLGVGFGGYQTMLEEKTNVHPLFRLKSYPLLHAWGMTGLSDKLSLPESTYTYLQLEITTTRGLVFASSDDSKISSFTYYDLGPSITLGSPVYLGFGMTILYEEVVVEPEYKELIEAIWDYFLEGEKPKPSTIKVKPHIKIGCQYYLTDTVSMRAEFQMNYAMPPIAKLGLTYHF